MTPNRSTNLPLCGDHGTHGEANSLNEQGHTNLPVCGDHGAYGEANGLERAAEHLRGSVGIHTGPLTATAGECGV